MKNLICFLLFLAPSITFAQLNDGLIQMAKHYRQFILRNTLTESAVSDFDKLAPTDLKFTSEFIKETLTDNNKLLSDKFLTRPSDKDLTYIYIVEMINYNIRKENPLDNTELIHDLLKKDVSPYELLETYYTMLFTGYGNKVKPYNMADVDFKINNYQLRDDTEKGIFFLVSMRFNGTMIWGFINIPKPPKYDRAMAVINVFPKYNDSPYYEYFDLSFPDFKLNIESETSKQSFKDYFINKFYETLLYHLESLKQTGASKDQILDLVLGSILKERNYYKFSKNQDELNKLLSVYKKQ